MDTFAGGALIVLFLVVLSNWRNGTLGDWLKAKFLNQAPGHTASSSSSSARATPAATSRAGSSTSSSFLVEPIPGAAITSPYGEHRSYETHQGIDYAAVIGTPVDAAGAGVVVSAGAAGGYGNRIVVDHGNGLQTLYAHLSSIGVHVGDRVNQGQVLGLSGMTGNATGPHLHFEVRLNGVPVNPLEWFLGKIKQVLS